MRAVGRAEDDARQRRARTFIDRIAIRRFHLRIGHEARFAQGGLFTGSQHEMINPFKEVSTRLSPHSVGKPVGERIPVQEQGDTLAQELFSLISQRPVKALG